MRFHEPILMDGYTYETKEGLMEKVRNATKNWDIIFTKEVNMSVGI